MKAVRNAIDSATIGATVVDLHDFDVTVSFPAFEAAYRLAHHPSYVTCKVPAESIHSIHLLEDAGFRFLEVQFRLVAETREARDCRGLGYALELVACASDLDAVLEIAGSTFQHDRFRRDPYLLQKGGDGAGGRRYQAYVRQSYDLSSDFVLKLVHCETNRIVGFKTIRMLSQERASLLLNGIRADLTGRGLGTVSDQLMLAELRRRGLREVCIQVSAANYAVINLEVRRLGFRVAGSSVVLRKVYEE